MIGKGEIPSGADSSDPDLQARVANRKVNVCIEYTILEKQKKRALYLDVFQREIYHIL
jgi:hypothetical protein